MIKNEKAKLIFRIIWLFVGAFATVLTITDHAAVFGGNGIPTTLFFTTWSVWLAFAASIAAFIPTVKKQELSQWVILFKFCALIMIIATFIVAGFVLPNKFWNAGYWTLGGTMKHFLLPVLTILDTIFFDEKNSYKIYYPFAALVCPLIYWIIVITRVCISRRAMGGSIPQDRWDFYYPYGFTNFDNGHSLGGLIKILCFITIGLIAIGFAFYFGKKSNKKS